MAQTRNSIDARHDHAVRGGNNLISPSEPGDRQVDQNQLIPQRCEIEQGIKRRHIQLASVVLPTPPALGTNETAIGLAPSASLACSAFRRRRCRAKISIISFGSASTETQSASPRRRSAL